MEFITINIVVEMEDLIELAEKVQKPEEATDIIKQYEEVLRTKKKGIIWLLIVRVKFSNASRRKSLCGW